MTQQLGRNLRVIGTATVIFIIVAFIALWVTLSHVSAPTVPGSMPNPVGVVPKNELPVMFPPNMLIGDGGPVVSNFNSAGVNGQLQATRSFQSSKSVDANFAIYQKFLAANATTWTVISQNNNPSDPGHKSILAKDKGGLLTITISSLPPQPLPETLVTITYITNPAPVPLSVTSSASK